MALPIAVSAVVGRAPSMRAIAKLVTTRIDDRDGEAGGGFLRVSCAEPDARLQDAVAFIGEAIFRRDRIEAYLRTHPEYRRQEPYVA